VELDVFEGMAPSETEEEPEMWKHRLLGIVLPQSFVKKKKGDDVCTPGQNGTLRREQRERLEKSHSCGNKLSHRSNGHLHHSNNINVTIL
jgi:hypothetical protein